MSILHPARNGSTQRSLREMPEIVSIPDEGLGNSSYVVDLEDGRLLVLDPERDPTPYLQMAERRAATVAFAVETHLHADFVSGSRELAAKGAKVVASASSCLEFPHAPFGDGDELDLGGLTLLALATPGHTPEHLAYLLLDGSRPVAVFSGGSLLPGSVARTDLISPELAEPLARALYRSVTERLLTLPDDLAVYPTHGTGATFCAAAPGGSRSSTTIGQEKASNPLLSVPDEDAFVARLLAGYGSHPDYFLRLRTVNKRGPRLYGDHPPPLEPLSPAEVRALIAQGVEVVDARPIADFAAGHIPGSLSNQLRPAFATWIGWLVPGDRPLVFVLNDDQDRSELIRQCLKIGYENITGELGGGMAAWRAEGFDENDVRLVGPPEFARDHGTVLDVRQESEFANVRLGINQGLTGSTTVIMKIDLVGPHQRGLAMGLNEASGYGAVALTAVATGFIAARYGLRPEPFFLALEYAGLGLALSALFVKETHAHARHEAANHVAISDHLHGDLRARDVFALTSLREPALSACSQAGLINNLNDGLAWGLFPLFFAGAGLGIAQIGILAAIYPGVWSIGQLVTGALSDRVGRKWLIASGMLVQAAGLSLIAATRSFAPWAAGAAVLGAGTAMVYPTLLAAVGDVAHPQWRASAIGVYRLWRDVGFAIGALVAGVAADSFGFAGAIWLVAALTAASGVVVSARMYETLPKPRGVPSLSDSGRTR